MELRIFEAEDRQIAELIAEDVVVHTVPDALDLMANADYQGSRHIIVHERQLSETFFDLRSGLAGEILQKYANYRVKLAIVGQFEKFQSNSLNAFMVECNRGRQFYFVPDREQAIARLSGG